MRSWFTGAVALLVASSSLFAQSASTSQIVGTVQDASGLGVPGAEVKLVETDTGQTRTAETGADGGYVLVSLPVGQYRLEISKQGFSTYVQNAIVLQVASNPTINATLQVGSVGQQVVVEASAAMVETRSSGVGQVVDQQRVVDLPLNGRTATDLIYLAGASATAPPADLVSAKNYPGEAVLSVAGGLANGTTYMLDGGTHNDPFNNLNLPLPFPDALQEFKVETSALPAQYGQHSAGAVNVVTKSGGNAFHGDAFEFVRNYEFNARNPAASVRDSLKRNQFGGTLGGPIKKDKLFFFLGYQGNIIRSNPVQAFSFIPTPQMMTGDFSVVTSPQCNGGKQINLKNPTNGTLFGNNQIPLSLFSPQAQKMMTFYPAPQDGCGTLYYGTVSNQDEHMGLAKGDYQLNTKQTLFLRYFVTHSLQPPPFNGTNPLSETASGADDLVNSGVFGHTFVIGPNMINTFRATYNRSGVTKIETPSFDANTLGIKMNTLVPGHIVVSATGAIYSSTVTSYAARDPVNDHQLADDFTWIKGNHQFAFGGNWIRSIQNVYGPLEGDGFFSFNGQSTGLSMADFLIGYAASFTQQGIQYDNERYHYLGLYAEDNWKLTPHLTVNYGLRWEPFIGGTFATGYVEHFDQALFNSNVHSVIYPNAPAGLQFPGDAGFNNSNRPSNTHLNDFAPRLGVVWDPNGDGKMTIRASWGIFYELPHTLFAYGFSEAPPWGENISRTNVLFGDPWGPVQNGGASTAFPGGDPFPLNLNKNFVFPNFGTYTTYPENIKPTYLEQWNLSVQRQISANWLLSASYLGNNTIHLWADAPINAPVFIPGQCVAGQYGLTAPGACSTTANQNFRRPLYLLNPTQGAFYGTIHSLDDGSTASYNALLISAQHRLASHFTILANYTWSHCIAGAFTSELDGVQYTNPNNRSFDRGNCAGIDHRTLINVSAVEEAPRFSNRFLQIVAGDWKLSEIMRIQSGSYFSVTTATDQALDSIGGQRAALVGSSPYASNQTFAQWLNPSAFAQPALGTFGTSPNNILGPGTFDINIALTREVRIRERQRLEFRAEAFNLLNHVQPTNPNASISTLSTFGRITVFGDPRIMQFALKYYF
jgi:Carboxypeptidase regulatory-like domain/TonB dependent receptor